VLNPPKVMCSKCKEPGGFFFWPSSGIFDVVSVFLVFASIICFHPHLGWPNHQPMSIVKMGHCVLSKSGWPIGAFRHPGSALPMSLSFRALRVACEQFQKNPVGWWYFGGYTTTWITI
jgi:hypothetical protein